MKTFRIETLGCKVNEYESAYYAAALEEFGYQPAEEGQPADVIIINTCTVTNTAAAKSRRKIHRLKRENPSALVAAVGCYAQTLEEDERQNLGVDLLIGASHKNELPLLIEQALSRPESLERHDYVETANGLLDFESMPIGAFEGQHRAFLKIQDGCNQYCAYCQIPLARGPERSQIPEDVVASAVALAEHGHQEIVLTGIHTGRYRFRQTDLSDLLSMLLEATPETVCFRISSIEITEVSDRLLDLMERSPRILPHLHIPIQAGDDRTLARMKRPYTVARFEERLDQIRRRIPDISISTDVIAGFVGESDDEFETTVQTLKDCRFSFLHVFPYSRRKGTAADSMQGFVSGERIKERTARLLDLSRQLRKQDMARFSRSQMLVEREDPKEPGWYTGYTSQYHPVRIYSETVVQGRINVRMTAVEDERYIAAAEVENETF